METIRKILTGKDNMLQIVLPDEYNNKRVELIILPAEEETAKVEEKKVDYSKYYGTLKCYSSLFRFRPNTRNTSDFSLITALKIIDPFDA